jgi:hypothetical protein
MNEVIQEPALWVDLSRAELLTVLGVMEARSIPGLAQAPVGSMTLEEAAEAEREAALALQERELAMTDDEGQFLVHRAVLSLVGACAYSQSALIAYHWQAGQETPVQFCGHVRNGDVVSHTFPAESVHRFGWLPSREALAELALETCEIGETRAAPPAQMLVPRDAFDRARDLASQGQAEGSAEVLRDAGVADEVADALSAALADAPSISAAQTIKQQGDSVRTREFTLIQGDGRIWLVMPTGIDPAGRLLAKTVGRAELSALLADWV